jgi:hypothetical protein
MPGGTSEGSSSVTQVPNTLSGNGEKDSMDMENLGYGSGDARRREISCRSSLRWLGMLTKGEGVKTEAESKSKTGPLTAKGPAPGKPSPALSGYSSFLKIP